MSAILTITLNPCIDRTVWVTEVVPEKKLRATRTEIEPGGGGINIARAVKAIGGNVTALFTRGSYMGLFFNELMQTEKIETLSVDINDTTRENTLLIDETTLHEYRIGMPGPVITKQEQENFLQILQQQNNFSYWVLSGSLNPKTPVVFYTDIAKLAIEKQVKLIVDTSSEALKALLKLPLFLVKPNLNELSLLCGKTLDTTAEIIKVGKQIVKENNITYLVVSLGKDGALMIAADKVYKAVPPLVEVKSTVGAGDCMVAGIVYGFSKGLNAKQALVQGIACGTAATLYSGYGLCKKEDVEMLLPQIVIDEV